MRSLFIAASLAAGVLLASGCTEKRPEPVGPAPEIPRPADAASPAPDTSDILIGEVGPLTGPEATFGDSTHKGIELALRLANEKGGVKGRRLAVRVVDDRGSAEEAAAAFAKLVDADKVVLVLGEATSTRSIAMAAVAEKLATPMISPAATNPKVTAGNAFVFRVCFTDPFQGYVMAKFARDNLKLSKVAVLQDPRNDYSVGLAQSFTARFKAAGGKVVREETYAAGATDFKAQIVALKAAEPEAIYLPGYYGDVGVFAQQARALGLKAPLLGGDGWSSGKLFVGGGAAIEGSYFSDHYSTQDPSPRIQEFLAEFRAAYGTEPDSFAALGYDALRVAANAIARAKSLSGPDLRDAIASTREFDGVTGVITVDAKHDATTPAVVLKVEGGKAVYQTTVAP